MTEQMVARGIGRVVAVDASQVTVELSKDLKALARATFEGAAEVGRINSYIIIPTGAHRVVGMVTRVLMSEEAQLRADQMTLSLPAARRHLYATLIGTIEGGSFEQGVSVFPVLDTPTMLAAQEDLKAIFGCLEGDPPVNPEKPGYCISIGKSAIFREYDVLVNPDIFFGKHVAVLGSTGSGKSCTVATMIQSVLTTKGVNNATFVIFDTNGEYRRAFVSDVKATSQSYKTLYLPSDPLKTSDRLIIPYWFMNSEDFCRLFSASEQTQRPVLIEALGRARARSTKIDGQRWFAELVDGELNRLLAALEDQGKNSKSVDTIASGLAKYLKEKCDLSEQVLGSRSDQLCDLLDELSKTARSYTGNNKDGEPIYNNFVPINVTAPARASIEEEIEHLSSCNPRSSLGYTTADSPVRFEKALFLDRDLEQAMRMQPGAGGKSREYCATMIMRIKRLLMDPRFDFLFGPADREWPSSLHLLATFLRDVLGLPSGEETLSEEKDVPIGKLPFYDRQRNQVETRHNVVIVDLSLLASEILENIIALLGRLILEFLQRASDRSLSGIGRGELPVVLVLEEAQNYIRETRQPGKPSVSRDVFERIAREGRKYGLGLVVASQRPSELSKTVLSQCNSFIVHRLQNPEDLRYFREIVPTIFEPLLKQLPSLPQRYALVLGEGVLAPTLTFMREASPTPDSQDPKLYAHWVAENPTLPNVEEICVRWEGKHESDLEDNSSIGGTLNEVEQINEDRSYEDEEVPF